MRMRVRNVSALGGLCLLAWGVAGAVAPIEPFTLEYETRLSGVKVGKVTSTLRRDGNGHYVYEKRAKTKGLARLFVEDFISERSEWELADGRPRPVRYDYLARDGDEEERHFIVFDWTRHKADNAWRRHRRELSIPDNATDRLTLEMRIIADVKDHIQPLEYTVVDRGKLKHTRFVAEGEESVNTPKGTFHAFKYRMIRDDDDGRGKTTLFWLAPDLGYLPVRIAHENKKKGYTLVLELHSMDRGLEDRASMTPSD
jgi:hypothetical protein